MKMNTGSFIANGSAVNVDVGFIPDFVIAFEGQEETNPQMHFWLRERIDSANSNAQYGILDTGGTKTKHAAAANGFATYDTSSPKQMLPAPDGDGLRSADLPNPWTQSRSTAATARSTTALGTIIKPTSGNETGLIYECTTAGTGAATEPTWPTVAGESVTDGSTVWISRASIIQDEGVKGFTLGATGQTDTDEWTWIAFAADKVSTEVDADNVDYV